MSASVNIEKSVSFQKADMAVIDLSITSQRQKAVDFTMPYMNTGEFFNFFIAFFLSVSLSVFFLSFLGLY
jgi:hypothetical protein